MDEHTYRTIKIMQPGRNKTESVEGGSLAAFTHLL